MNSLAKLRIRYAVIALYISTIWFLCMACLINLSKISHTGRHNCNIENGINTFTHISIWPTSILWLIIASIHYGSYPVFKRLINNTVTDADQSVIQNYMYYIYVNVIIGIISSINLSKIYRHDNWLGCDSLQINMLTAIHSLNIFAASYIPAMYIFKHISQIIGAILLLIRWLLARVKRHMFNPYLPDNMELRNENGHHVLVNIEVPIEAPTDEPPVPTTPIMTNGNGNCQICMSDTKLVMVQLLCKHKMCIECCQEWLSRHTTCPFCRGELTESAQQPESVVSVPAAHMSD